MERLKENPIYIESASQLYEEDCNTQELEKPYMASRKQLKDLISFMYLEGKWARQ